MIWLIFIHLCSNAAQAEYRAFELVIETPAIKASRTVQSTLDPEQYVGYFPLAAGETVRMAKTWRCRGNTSNFKPICPQSSFGPPPPTLNAQK
jgi:hypothetical protein